LYLSGTLVLKNRVTLLIERGATLQGSRNIEHYPNLVPKIPYLYSDRFCKYLIYADGAGDIGCSITGIPQAAIENVALHNIRIEFQGGGAGELGNAVIPEKVPAYPQEIMFGKLPAYGLFCRHVKNLSLDNVAFHFVRPDHRPALACDDVGNLQLSRFNADLSPDAEEMMRLKNVAGASIHNCGSPRDIPVLLRLSGKRCRRIALTGAEQFNILKPISLDDDVPPDAVVGRHDSNR